MSFTELHFHLLPGVDDGPPSIEDSVELARTAASEGTRTIVTTPHVNLAVDLDIRTLPERVREVERRLRREQVPVRVCCGGELAAELVWSLSEHEFELIAQGPPGKRWLLLEAPLTGLGEGFAAAARELRARGFGIVVAHPERALGIVRSGWQIIEDEVRAGSALQLNAWSLAGLHGERARAEALRLLHVTRLVAVSSDAHGPERPPSLRLALDTLAGLGEHDPERFVAAVPELLLERGLSARISAAVA